MPCAPLDSSFGAEASVCALPPSPGLRLPAWLSSPRCVSLWSSRSRCSSVPRSSRGRGAQRPVVPPLSPVAPRWAPDPTCVHDYRYWNGTRWTARFQTEASSRATPSPNELDSNLRENRAHAAARTRCVSATQVRGGRVAVSRPPPSTRRAGPRRATGAGAWLRCGAAPPSRCSASRTAGRRRRFPRLRSQRPRSNDTTTFDNRTDRGSSSLSVMTSCTTSTRGTLPFASDCTVMSVDVSHVKSPNVPAGHWQTLIVASGVKPTTRAPPPCRRRGDPVVGWTSITGPAAGTEGSKSSATMLSGCWSVTAATIRRKARCRTRSRLSRRSRR